MENIVEIKVKDIHEHPNNPRKALGDLAELSASIKANGIFQNLTVVPGQVISKDETAEGGYTVIIGHRRLAAAKKAGLETVPCSIVDMTYKEQVKTMLIENMQRQDLTLIEQAQGFQLMMDLGDSIKTIAADSGFSQQTIKHRVKLLDFNQAQLQKEMTERQIPMEHLIKLEAIKDKATKDNLLFSAGTQSFEWNYQRALKDQTWKKDKKTVIDKLLTLGVTKMPSDIKTWQCDYITCIDNPKFSFEPAEDKVYHYDISNHSCHIYAERSESAKEVKENAEAKRLEDELKKKFETIKEKYELIKTLRLNFIKERFGKGFGESKYSAIKELAKAFVEDFTDTVEEDTIALMFGKDVLDADGDVIEEKVMSKDPLDLLLVYMLDDVVAQHDNNPYYYYEWQKFIAFRDQHSFKRETEMLEALGYEMSDEEKLFVSGGLINEQPSGKKI